MSLVIFPLASVHHLEPFTRMFAVVAVSSIFLCLLTCDRGALDVSLEKYYNNRSGHFLLGEILCAREPA